MASNLTLSVSLTGEQLCFSAQHICAPKSVRIRSSVMCEGLVNMWCLRVFVFFGRMTTFIRVSGAVCRVPWVCVSSECLVFSLTPRTSAAQTNKTFICTKQRNGQQKRAATNRRRKLVGFFLRYSAVWCCVCVCVSHFSKPNLHGFQLLH